MSLQLIYLIASLFFLSSLSSDEPIMEVTKYESITGLKGSYEENEKVFKVSFPRDDIKVFVDDIQLDPFMGLTTWVAFTPANPDEHILMGDLVLFQDEVNPVISTLLSTPLEITALHNHFFYDRPHVYFMHIEGKGPIIDLADGIKKALGKVKEIRTKNSSAQNSFGGSPISKKSAINLSSLENVFNIKGQSKEGMVKFIFGRTINMDGVALGKSMGINTWVAFCGTTENAIVDGDFSIFEDELKSVIEVLRKGNINIVAIHNHMTMESPRMIFLHYWGRGNTENLAKTLKEALDLLK